MHLSLPFRHLLLLALLCLQVGGQAHSSNSVLIWPIDPVIESDERATALWLENRGDAPAQMQLRVFEWQQIDLHDHYETGHDVVGSPPMIRIEPGERQLIRLTRTVDVPPGVERAFRVIIDEIPTPEPEANEGPVSVGIKFQMRYSIPLFVYGEGLWTKVSHDRRRDPADAAQPSLSWRIQTHDGKPHLQVHNAGNVHARLTEVAFQQQDVRVSVSEGLLGYVLPGATMHWPLPDDYAAGGELVAKVNGSADQLLIASAR